MGTLAAGIKEIFATAKTTGSNVMLCGNDGTPDGHMNMANLASVLGVTQRVVGETDLNNLRAGLYWTIQQEGTFQTYHYPSKEWGMLIVLDNGSGSTKQIHFGFGGANYERYRYERGGGWSDWRQYAFDVPTFYNSYSNLSDLANALGVTKRMEFVDLGLPSGTLWATRNLGAETPEDYGYYFSWGNVIGRKPNGTTFDYDWGANNDGNYASTPGAALTGDIPTNMDYDAVQRYMGGSCKMPEKNQFVELFNSSYTTNEWTTKNGVNGRLVTSKINSNSIFFPAAGYGYGESLLNEGSGCGYWSRSLGSSADGCGLRFDSSGVNPQNYDNRFLGFSVRAVQ